MTALRATFLFGLRGLWTHRETLGTTHTLERNGHRIEIALPKDNKDFCDWKELPGLPYTALGGWSGTKDDPQQAWNVLVVRVTVQTQGDFSREDFSDGDIEITHRGIAVADAAQALAQEAVKDFVAMIRARHGFSWMGLSSDRIEQVGPASLLEADSGERIPVGPTLTFGSVLIHQVADALTPEDVAEVVRQIEAGEQAPVAEALLADAEYLAWAGDRGAHRRAGIF
jgi:hypothetical protein